MAAEVSVLVPAYMAENFIDRTLYFARGQTYADIRILVSVDKSEDGTLARVTAHAAEDRRIVVFGHDARLGWAGNVNFLLDQAATPFCFLYFHDDIIVPQYVERLLAVLQRSPDAAMVHCDVQCFGGSDIVVPGRQNDGPAADRLMTFMLAPSRGAPLRGLMRRSLTSRVRLPDDRALGLWANEAFLMELIAAGPSLRLPEVLYMNWLFRPGGLTVGWREAGAEAAFAALRFIFARAIAILDQAARNEEERDAFHFACYLWQQPLMANTEARVGQRLFVLPHELHPAFDAAAWPRPLDAFGAEIAAWAATRWAGARNDLAARGAL